MKKIRTPLIGILLWLGFTQAGWAQSKTIEYFIHLTTSTSVTGYLMSQPNLEMAALSSPLDSLVNSTRLKEVLRKGTILDALNYLSQQGWQLVGTTSIPFGSSGEIHTRVYYLLKKQLVVQQD